MTIEELGKQIEAHSLPLEIIVHRSADESEFSSNLYRIAAVLCDAGGSEITCREGTGRDVPGVPAVTFRRPASGIINYMAVPADREFAPFSEMLLWRLKDNADAAGGLRHSLAGLDRPVSIAVFIAASCPHCPNAARAANQLALCSTNITATIIDAEQFPALAERFKIRSVPMTVIDDELLIDEVVPPGDLVSAIMSKNGSGYLEAALLSNVNTGNIDLATRLLLDKPQTAAAFLDVWRRSSLSSRMGLMLMAAQSLEESPDVFDRVVPGLIGLLDAADVALKGDTVDLLGQIGHPDARGPLELLLQDGNPDIVEIVEDALEQLGEREEQQE